MAIRFGLERFGWGDFTQGLCYNRRVSSSPESITALIAQMAQGDRSAYDTLFVIAYGDLRKLAHRARAQLNGHALNTTGLVHECYLRLLKAPPKADGHAHFLAIMAKAMRHVLIEEARAATASKRGGGKTHISLSACDHAVLSNAEELIVIDQMLEQLAQQSPQQVAIVECRFFAGLSDQETADALQVPLRTVQREWARVREWMVAQAAS